MKLRYTPKGLVELEAILDYIAERSPNGARNVQNRVQSIATLLLQHPYMGTPGKRDMRRVAASPYPYLIFYQVMDDEIVIVGIRHSARHPSTMPGCQTM